jgi:hypothetical protein
MFAAAQHAQPRPLFIVADVQKSSSIVVLLTQMPALAKSLF